jgi:hypothetical protein
MPAKPRRVGVIRAVPGEPALDAVPSPPSLPLVALHSQDPLVMPEIEPAPRWRDWMNATPGRSANRCLPLLMANEAGWVLKNPAAFTATWNGSDARDAVTVEYEDSCPANRRLASSHFGSGVLTWAVPCLFRTPTGFNLLVRGPANWPKDGICALDGLVETDWSVATFTMNWKMTRPDHPITFDEGVHRALRVRRRHPQPACRVGAQPARDPGQEVPGRVLRRVQGLPEGVGAPVLQGHLSLRRVRSRARDEAPARAVRGAREVAGGARLGRLRDESAAGSRS